MTSASVARLRRFASRTADHSSCDLCRCELADRHRHLLELARRRVWCACDACALLFVDATASRFRLIPQAVTRIHLRLSDETWSRLGIPIGLAYFTIRQSGEVAVGYPSPAGPVMSSVEPNDWQSFIEAHADLGNLQSEVQSLLINRATEHRSSFIVPIDVCFELIGIVRCHWQGWSGGPDVQQRIDRYFVQLDATAQEGCLL